MQQDNKNNNKKCAKTHVSLFVLWQQLVDGVGKQARVAFGVFTDALHQLRVFFSHVVQLHKEAHLLPVGQSHLSTNTPKLLEKQACWQADGKDSVGWFKKQIMVDKLE